jgi:chromate transporter
MDTHQRTSEGTDPAPSAAERARRRYGHPIPFSDAVRVWIRIACLSFGGPAGQIAVMHRILVEEKRWIGERRFLHALNYCMLLPGPEAQQLATYIGWLLHRTAGGLAAGILFVLPGFVSILILSLLYTGYRDVPAVDGIFFGVKAAVLAVVVEAVLRIGRRVLRNATMYVIAAAAFVAIFFFDLAFPLIVLGAALIGFLGGRLDPDRFLVLQGHAPEAHAATLDALLDDGGAQAAAPGWRRAARTAAIWLALWLIPVIALLASLGSEHVFSQIAVFFSKLAVVTFGGAYAVLAYMAQQAVQTHGWLSPGEMLDGLGLAETTPGPLIMVVQFVGFLGAFRDAGALNPYVAGVLASVLATWVTFVPCFLWIFLGAPFVERLRDNRALSTALAGITAAVVGVILNLALWFGLHVVFGRVAQHHIGPLRLLAPDIATLDPAALVLCAGALVAVLRLRIGMLPTLAACAASGLAWRLLAI